MSNYGTNGYVNYSGYQGYGNSNPYLPQYQATNVGYQQQPAIPQQPVMNTQQKTPNFLPPLQGVQFATEDEVKAYLVPPASRIMFMDRDKQVFYIKSADGLGVSNIECYSFQRIDLDNQKASAETPSIDTSDLVKKEDLQGFVTTQQFSDAMKKLDDLQKRLDDSLL